MELAYFSRQITRDTASILWIQQDMANEKIYLLGFFWRPGSRDSFLRFLIPDVTQNTPLNTFIIPGHRKHGPQKP